MYTATKGSKGKVTWKETDQVRSGAQRAVKTGRGRRGVRCTNRESDEFSITPEDAEEAGHGPFVEYKSALGPNGSMTAVYGLESIDGKASTSTSDTTSSRKMLPKYREE
jgi:hypothetical protein